MFFIIGIVCGVLAFIVFMKVAKLYKKSYQRNYYHKIKEVYYDNFERSDD